MTPSTAHRQTCRDVMSMAWVSKRAEPGRSMSDCMKGAWRFVKGTVEAAAKFMTSAARTGGRVRMRDTLHAIRPSGFSGSALRGGRKVSARMAWGS